MTSVSSVVGILLDIEVDWSVGTCVLPVCKCILRGLSIDLMVFEVVNYVMLTISHPSAARTRTPTGTCSYVFERRAFGPTSVLFHTYEDTTLL